MKRTVTFALAALATLAVIGWSASQAQATDDDAILKTYADIAAAKYGDSLATAKRLDRSVDAFLAKPGKETLAAARQAWIAARVPYQQTEVYRFGNVIVDAWEGKVNSWPLDEGLIDYVDASYGTSSDENRLYTANVIAHPTLKTANGTIDAGKIDKTLIRSLHEVDDVEANVATGYHAIEFLLWGQDLNGTGPGAGDRPWTDYALDQCTNGHCDRRRAYLKVATDLLVDDLTEMAADWQPGGQARAALTANGAKPGLSVILTGMGSLSYGELAGERMKLGLLLHDREEEQDCFSDNTHNAHYYDAMGIRGAYLGRYEGLNGNGVQGPSLSDLVKARAPHLDAEMRGKLDATMAAMTAIKTTADNGVMAYDQMIGEGNAKGNAMVQAAIDALIDQTKTIEKVVSALGLGRMAFESSDSLDNPGAVFQ